MKINAKKYILGFMALLVAGIIWEVANGVKDYHDVTIVGKVIGGICGIAIVGFVLYVFGVMIYQQFKK